MTQTFDILGFGAIAVDDLLYVDEYPPAESKVRVQRRLRQCGGLTGTALVTAARLGARTAYVGVIGDDPLSQEVLDRFRKESVETKYSVPRPDAKPGHSTIIVDQVRKTRTVFSCVAGRLGADPELPTAEVIRSGSVLLIDHHGVEGTLRAVRIARESGIAVVADFERHVGHQFDELLDRVDHLIVSAKFARDVTGESEPADAVRSLWTSDRSAVIVDVRFSRLLVQRQSQREWIDAHPGVSC